MRLRVFKDLINGFTQGVYPNIPVTKATYPITKMLEQLGTYFLKSAKAHPERFYKDGNFPRLVKTVIRMLIYVAERDSHYRAMLSILCMQIYAQMDMRNKYSEFKTPQEMLSWLSGQKIEYVPEDAQHLYTKARTLTCDKNGTTKRTNR